MQGKETSSLLPGLKTAYEQLSDVLASEHHRATLLGLNSALELDVKLLFPFWSFGTTTPYLEASFRQNSAPFCAGHIRSAL